MFSCMSLRVYAGKNQASRRYELEFFRVFASVLSAQFEAEGRDGVLLGHPLSRDNTRFQPDALLITSNSVVLVDFKNFDNARIRLPDEGGFTTAEWKSEEGVVVKGGNSSNPFAQLQKQSRWMMEILAESGIEVVVQSCVLFHGDVEVVGKVPGRYQAFFSIANKYDYPNVLNDSINVKSGTTIYDFESLVSRFEVSPFRDYPAISADDLGMVSAVAEVSLQRQHAAQLAAVAEKKRREAEDLLGRAEREGASILEAKLALAKATEQATSATAEAEKIRHDFDEKKYQLELARQLTAQKNAEIVVEKTRVKRGLLTLVSLLLVFAVGGAGIAWWAGQQRALSDELRADQAAGRACIAAAEAASFIGKSDVCVTFTVRHVGESNRYLFIQEQYRGDFTALVMSKTIFSKAEAQARFEGEIVEVRGDIEAYEGSPQIKVFESSQIVLSD